MKTKLKTQGTLVAAFVIAGLLFAACNKDNMTPSGNTASTAPYNMYMTDAPAAYQQVNVNISGAMVHSSTAGWVSLGLRPGIYNLLSLCNGRDTLIASGQIATGMVSQVRLILAAGGNTVMVNNTLYPLQTPSDQQSGLTLNVDENLVKDALYSLTIDFDAGASVVQTGNGSYILKPVLRAVVTSSSGGIKGTISPASAAGEIIAVQPTIADTATTFASVATGGFWLQALAQGTYQVMIVPTPPYAIQTINDVTVTNGNITDMGTITLH